MAQGSGWDRTAFGECPFKYAFLPQSTGDGAPGYNRARLTEDHVSGDNKRRCNFGASGEGMSGLENFSMARKKTVPALVSVVMGSASDWETMRHCVDLLEKFAVPNEHKIVSAHRTPELMAKFARTAAERGVQVIIAGAGGAAHLPGMIAAQTWLPVLGVPVESRALKGLDSLLSIAQMPAGIAVGTLAIGVAGAKNAALLAASIIGLHEPKVRAAVQKFRQRQTKTVLAQKLP